MNPSAPQSKTEGKALLAQGGLVLMVGPSPKGPQRCLHCGQPFKPGEAWRRYTSPPDAEFGQYSVGIHEKCVSQ